MADIPRAPVYVNRPNKRFTQTDVGRNVAVAIVAAVALVRPLVEPTFYKKKAYQPDVYPNVAVRETFELLTSYATSDLQRRQWAAVDVFPNLAARQSASASVLIAAPEPTQRKVRAQQPDVYPNIAVQVQVVDYKPPPAFDPVIRRQRPLQPDVYPNLAVNYLAPQSPAPAMVEPAIKPKKFYQTDVAPNVSAKSAAEIPRIPAMIHPTLFVRHFAQVDVYQNIAVNYVPPVAGPDIHNVRFIYNVGTMMGRS